MPTVIGGPCDDEQGGADRHSHQGDAQRWRQPVQGMTANAKTVAAKTQHPSTPTCGPITHPISANTTAGGASTKG